MIDSGPRQCFAKKGSTEARKHKRLLFSDKSVFWIRNESIQTRARQDAASEPGRFSIQLNDGEAETATKAGLGIKPVTRSA
jgi:hypothetical protein